MAVWLIQHTRLLSGIQTQFLWNQPPLIKDYLGSWMLFCDRKKQLIVDYCAIEDFGKKREIYNTGQQLLVSKCLDVLSVLESIHIRNQITLCPECSWYKTKCYVAMQVWPGAWPEALCKALGLTGSVLLSNKCQQKKVLGWDCRFITNIFPSQKLLLSSHGGQRRRSGRLGIEEVILCSLPEFYVRVFGFFVNKMLIVLAEDASDENVEIKAQQETRSKQSCNFYHFPSAVLNSNALIAKEFILASRDSSWNKTRLSGGF